MTGNKYARNAAFTIVEILVVMVIIAIIATVTVLAYNGIQHNAMVAITKNDLKQANTQLNVDRVENGAYPADLDDVNGGEGLKFSNEDAVFYYTPYNDLDPKDYCLTVVVQGEPFKVTRFTAPTEGFCSDQLPDAPEASASTDSTSQITVSWDGIDDADTYRVEYSTSSSFSTSSSIDDISSTSQPVTGLSSSTTYYFRVFSVNVLGESNASETVSATTNTAAPSSSPTVTLDVQSTSEIDVSWTSVSGATSYRLNYSTSSNMSSPTTINDIGGTSQSIDSLSSGTQYYVQVFGVNIGGVGPGSTVQSTSTFVDPPSAPSINATTNSPTQITVSWSAVSGADHYVLDYSTSSGFSGATTIEDIEGTSQAVSGLSQGQRYYFRAYAVNQGGSSPASSSDNATTTISAPDSPSVSATIPGGTRAWNSGIWAKTYQGQPTYGTWYYAQATISSSTCASGTTREWRARIQYNSPTTWGAWTSWSTSSTRYAIQPSGGYGIRFQAQTRCYTSYATSGTSSSGYGCRWKSTNSSSCSGF